MGNCIYCLSKNSKNIQEININKFDLLKEQNSLKEQISSKKIDSSKIKKIFISYNILDYEKNIIIGIWDNSNKSNTLGNQGIWIGGHDKIFGLIFGIICIDIVILYFENNIELKIYKNNSSDLFFELTENKNNYIKQINNNIKKKLKKINNNSQDIDLIFSLFDHE